MRARQAQKGSGEGVNIRSGVVRRFRFLFPALRVSVPTIIILICTALIAGGAARVDDLESEANATAFGIEEGQALLRIVRRRANPGLARADSSPLPARLEEKLHLPLLVTFFRNGPTRFQHVATRPTLRESAEQAGIELAHFFSKFPDGEKSLTEGRIHLDIVVGRKALFGKNRALLAQTLAPGLDGLICTTERGKSYFTPLTLLRYSRSLDPIKDMYISQESVVPPPQFKAERFRSISYVEETPGGKALALYRGNVPLPPPQPWDTFEAMSAAGVRLMAMEQSDGSFIPVYHPADEEFEQADNTLAVCVRATLAMTLALPELQHQLGEARPFEDYKRALRFAASALREENGKRIAYLPVKNDPVTPSALLLATLCRQALSESKPTVTGKMRYLGEFLCVMTTADGRIHNSLANALAEKPPYMVKGEPYVEALMALTLLQRIAPIKRVGDTVEQLAKRVAGMPITIPRIGPDVRIWPRTIEALAEYYKLTRTKEYGILVLNMTEQLIRYQVKPGRGEYPDYEGGFTEPDLPPSTRFTASSISALAAAYNVGNMLRQPVNRFAVPLRRAAGFLNRMQYRPENSFFLRRPELTLGAFRRSPEDLSIHVATVAEAVRALKLATMVIAQAMPPEPMKKRIWQVPTQPADNPPRKTDAGK